MDCSLQAPLTMGSPRQEYWSGLPFLTPEDLPDPRIKPTSVVSPALQEDSLLLAPPVKPQINCTSIKTIIFNRETLKVVENMIDLEPTTDSPYDISMHASQCITASVFPSVSPQPSLTASPGGCRRLMKKRDVEIHYKTVTLHANRTKCHLPQSETLLGRKGSKLAQQKRLGTRLSQSYLKTWTSQ